WNDGTEQELFSMDELIARFDFDRVHKAGARFDPEKVKWYNEQWLRKQSDEVLATNFSEQLILRYGANDRRATLAFATGAIHLLKERVQFEHEFYATGAYLFEQPGTYDEKVVSKRWTSSASTFVQAYREALSTHSDWKAEALKSAFESLAAAQGIKPGEVLQLFRVVVSGQGSGVDLFGMVELLGREEVLARIDQALQTLPAVTA
ncbi:MAG: glutamate--tRNA ligase, partial [Bacteroidota bacterium]